MQLRAPAEAAWVKQIYFALPTVETLDTTLKIFTLGHSLSPP